MVEFMQQRIEVTSEINCETIKKKLRRAIENKRPGMLTYGVVLPHDNAHPHKAVRSRELVGHFNWELSDHPPYSPDLAPSDYHLFTRPS
jgi:histone-lysine N-methyltransferase SETMAR